MPFENVIEFILIVGLIIYLLFQMWALGTYIRNGGNGLSKYTFIRYALTALYLTKELTEIYLHSSYSEISVLILFAIFVISSLSYIATVKETSINKDRGYGVRPITLADSQPIKRRSASGTREILLSRIDDSKPFKSPHVDLKKSDGKE